MAQSRFIRTCGLLFVISALTFSASANTSARTEANQTTLQKHRSTVVYAGGNTYMFTCYAYSTMSPALVPNQFVMPELKPEYLRPLNTPKYDNRLKSFAQLWRDQNMRGKIIYS